MNSSAGGWPGNQHLSCVESNRRTDKAIGAAKTGRCGDSAEGDCSMPGRRGGGGAGADRHGRFTLLSSNGRDRPTIRLIWRLNGSNSTAAAPSKIVERKANPGTRTKQQSAHLLLLGWLGVEGMAGSRSPDRLLWGFEPRILWAFVMIERSAAAERSQMPAENAKAAVLFALSFARSVHPASRFLISSTAAADALTCRSPAT